MIKTFILHPSEDDVFDPPSVAIIKQIEGRTDEKSQADVILVSVTKHPDYRFNKNLVDEIGGKPWVLFDWTEVGWDWTQEETMLYGVNTFKFFGDGYNEHWKKFDQFVRDHPPILTFKRELLEKDRTDRLLPIEYLNHLRIHGNDTKEDFDKRPLDLLFNWGRSHEARMWFHGAIFINATALGYEVISEWHHIDPSIADNPKSFKWASIHAPHHGRIDVNDVQTHVRKAKITAVWPGAGEKTFRTGEVCGDAIMAIPESGLAYSYPWTSANSIIVPRQLKWQDSMEACKRIRDALMNPDLYSLYCAAMENAQNYVPDTYLRRHVMGNIERAMP